MPEFNRPLELTWLQDFLTLAESGNFSRAAGRRHMTQPAFSRRIRMLEDWLGVPLFDRTGQPVTLTEAGREFRSIAEDVLRRLTAGRERVQTAANARHETLRFAATHALSLTFFPTWLRSVETRLHVGPIQLISDSLSACEEMMLQGQVQFLLCHSHPEVPTPLQRSGFRHVVIGTDELVPVVRTRGGGKLPAFLERGAAIPVLAYSSASGLGRILRDRARTIASDRLQSITFTSHVAVVLKALAIEGRGVAWLPRSLVEEELASGLLAVALKPEWTIPLEILLVRRDLTETAATETFWQAAVPSDRASSETAA
jgi:DNA-binding transcriptional LysR family regulator